MAKTTFSVTIKTPEPPAKVGTLKDLVRLTLEKEPNFKGNVTVTKPQAR
jgi:hypothetical protein